MLVDPADAPREDWRTMQHLIDGFDPAPFIERQITFLPDASPA